MRVLIAYESKSGTTEECVRLLAQELHGTDVTIEDLSYGTPELSGYDAVFAGSYVRFGKVGKRFSMFLEQKEKQLLHKHFGLFLCCGEPQNFEDYQKRLLPTVLVAHAFDVECFGGSLELYRFHGMERLAVRMLRSSIQNSTDHNEGHYEKTLPAILPENIGRFVTKFRSETQKSMKV